MLLSNRTAGVNSSSLQWDTVIIIIEGELEHI